MAAHWSFTFRDKPYTFTPERDLTLRTLECIYDWYGKDIGTYKRFMEAFGDIDAHAIACVIWIARRKASENPPGPKDMEDFAIGADFLDTLQFVPDVAEEETPNPLDSPVESEKTSDSTPSPENSEDAI